MSTASWKMAVSFVSSLANSFVIFFCQIAVVLKFELARVIKFTLRVFLLVTHFGRYDFQEKLDGFVITFALFLQARNWPVGITEEKCPAIQ